MLDPNAREYKGVQIILLQQFLSIIYLSREVAMS